MSERSDFEFLKDILEAIRRTSLYIDGMSYDFFLEDIKTQDAVIRNVEIIGEAAKGISERLRAKHFHLPWKNMAGMRDRLIHKYFGVNLEVVWHLTSDELSKLGTDLERIAKAVNPDESR